MKTKCCVQRIVMGWVMFAMFFVALPDSVFAQSPINIGSISPDIVLGCGENSAEIWVSDIYPTDKIYEVWADIRYYSDPNAVTGDPVIGLPLSRDWTSDPNNPVFRHTFDNFSKAGTYHVCVYARDMNDKESEHICTTVTTGSCSVMKGNLNNDSTVDLADAILGLKILSGITVSVNLSAEVNKDNRIGMEEVIYILQFVAGLRQ